jgi:seryl-tRNA synthetase
VSVDDERAFHDELVHRGLLRPLGVAGIVGRDARFEHVLAGVDRHISCAVADDGAERMQFPPVIPRRLLEQSGFLSSFPHLAGTVFSFDGDDAAHTALRDRIAGGHDWSASVRMTDLALTAAACYPVYAGCTGTLPSAGRLIDLSSYCFRHEPSSDPARLQAFRMREHVRLGHPDAVLDWRAGWIERGASVLRALGLAVEVVPASDPFFGRRGKLLAASQRDQKLKLEAVAPIGSSVRPTAIMSLNYHEDHFASTFAIATADGGVAHTACLGFGLERIVLALFRAHGFELDRWPEPVRRRLAM